MSYVTLSCIYKVNWDVIEQCHKTSHQIYLCHLCAFFPLSSFTTSLAPCCTHTLYIKDGSGLQDWKLKLVLKNKTAAIFLIDQKVADSIHPPIYARRSPRSMVLCDESVTKLMSHCLCWFWLVMHLSIFNLECTAVSVFTAILMPNQCRSSLTDSTGVENNRLCNVFDSRFDFFSSFISADVLLIAS